MDAQRAVLGAGAVKMTREIYVRVLATAVSVVVVVSIALSVLRKILRLR